MVSAFLGRLCVRSPRLRRALWRGWYDLLAGRYRSREWTFMNYGYVPEGPAPPLDLDPRDEPDRHAIQLYRHLTDQVELTGAAVLEVGCGRGGGCAYLARTLAPASMVGVDFSERAIRFCRVAHAEAALRFRQGDAEALPFPDGSFDAVLNVESSHCYGSLSRFLAEVARVLRPDGRFLWADLCPANQVGASRRQFEDAGFSLQSEALLTPGVLRALDQMSEGRTTLIRRLVPPALVRPVEDFAGVPGSRVYESLRRGDVQYVSRVMRSQRSPRAAGC